MASTLLTGLIHGTNLDGNSNDVLGSRNGTDTSITYSSGNGKIIQGAGFASASSSKIVFGSITLPATFTYATWVKFTTLATGNYLFDHGSGVGASGSSRTVVQIAGDNKVHYSNFSVEAVSSTALTNNTWYCLIITNDGSTGNIYIDDVSKGSAGVTHASTTDAFSFGTRVDDPTGNYLGGAKDIVMLASRVWTAAERTEFYNLGVGVQYPFSAPSRAFSPTLSLLGVG